MLHECWVRPEDLGRRQSVVSKWNVEGMFEHRPSHKWRLAIERGGRLAFEVSTSNGSIVRCESDRRLDLDRWHHLRAEYSQERGTLAVDLDGSRAEAKHGSIRRAGRSVPTLGATRAGTSKDASDLTDFFVGRIDDVRLYDYAVSDRR